jgi:hypothetical protein
MAEPGIELRVRMADGVVLAGDSISLHYIAKYSGVPEGEWFPVLETNIGLIIEIKAVVLGAEPEKVCTFPNCQCNMNVPFPECCEAKRA